MKRLDVYCHGNLAGTLVEVEPHRSYTFMYHPTYKGPAISLTMPLIDRAFTYDKFPCFFEGLLPENLGLQAFLESHAINPEDPMGQLEILGQDLPGAITIKKAKD